jgi:serine protease Do
MKKVLQWIIIFFLSINLYFSHFVTACEKHKHPQTLADVVSKLSPSVVNISTTQEVKLNLKSLNEQQLDILQKFFQHGFGDHDSGLNEESLNNNNNSSKVFSLGSGFLIDAEGHIVTNEHVISQADEINITIGTEENKVYKAKVVGKDKRTDLALLKIDISEKLPFITFGDSDSIRVGDDVIAIGNAFGFGGSVTKGIVSAKGRDLGGSFFEEFIQTDASINKGNSGGPMLNMHGEVVGVNTAILSPTGVNIGIGFAIPSNTVKNIIEQLKANGKVKRGWLGIKFQPVPASMAKALSAPEGSKGAIINKVYANSPAAKAGLKIDDFIYAFNGKPLNQSNDLAKFVSHAKAGQEIALSVLREGKKKTIKVILEEPETDDPFDESKDNTVVTKIAGLYVANLNHDIRHKFHIPDDINEGAVIVKKDKQTKFSKLHVGDVVISIINKGHTHKINSSLVFRNTIVNILQEKKPAIAFKVLRKGMTIYVEGKLDDDK